jgi:predicted dehydrogenase
MSVKALSVGLIGAGKIAQDFHIPVLRSIDEARIAWIADVDGPRAAALGKANRLRSLTIERGKVDLPPCDVVLLAIPLPAREGYFRFFAATPTAVFAEKPLANDAAHHRALVNEFQGWRLSVGYQRRQYATSRYLKRLIAEEPFGSLTGIRISEGGRTTRSYEGGPYQDVAVAQGGGIAKNIGCHSLDLAFWLTGATGFDIIDRSIEWDGQTDRRCAADMWLRDVGGVAGADCRMEWAVSWLDHQDNTVELQFEHARFRCPIGPSCYVEVASSRGDWKAPIEIAAGHGATTFSQAFYLEWLEVLRGVSSQTENAMSGRSAILTAELIDALLWKPTA